MNIKLNLIPPYRKEEIKKAYHLRLILKWETELFLVFILFVAALASMNYIIKINLSVVANGLELANRNSEQYKMIEKYDNKTKEINGVVSRISKIQDSQLYWSKFLSHLNEKVSPGIEISKLTTQNYSISLVGKADNRDNLIAFKDNIVNEDCFTDVNLPVSNFVSRENIDFQMDLKIKKECLN